MKFNQWVSILLLGVMALPSLAYNREPSIQKEIDISAHIVTTIPISPSLYIEVPQRSTTLVWNDTLNRFNDFYFQFDAWLSLPINNPDLRGINLRMMDINMRCQTRTGSYTFTGLKDDPGNASTPHYTAALWIPTPYRFRAEWKRVPSILVVPKPNFNIQRYNPETNKEEPYIRGYIQFTPPDMQQIKADGGGTCLGGALLMFSYQLY
ncbi:hypothetical protein ABN225_11640 [Providencia alcalifaciens]